MALFLQEDVSKLLRNKFVVVLGDSNVSKLLRNKFVVVLEDPNQRSVYKDLVNLLQINSYTKASDLKTKGEHSFMDDQLLHGGRKGKMLNGVNYREVRQYKTDYHLIRFYFVTRSYNQYVGSIWEDLSGIPQPDVIIMNSCLWDVSRYGPTSMDKYKVNLEKTFRAATDAMPPECLFIWNTALPVANKIKGGFLLPELDFLCNTLRLDVLEGNYYAKELAGVYGLDVLDLHYFFRYQLHRRAPDGVHWNHQAHRRITNLILTHIANAWGLEPPRHMDALNRNLPAVREARPPTPNAIPEALNFIDFDKPVAGSSTSSSRPKLMSCPAAIGKPPEEEVSQSRAENGPCRVSEVIEEVDRPRSANSVLNLDDYLKSTDDRPSSRGSQSSLPDNLPDNRPSSRGSQSDLPDNRPSSRGSQSSLPDNLPDNHPSSRGSHSDLPDNRPSSRGSQLNLPDNHPSSRGSKSSIPDNRPSSVESPGLLSDRPNSASSIPRLTGNRPITPPCSQPGLLGNPPMKQAAASNRAPRQRSKPSRFAPYNNNNNGPQRHAPQPQQQFNDRPGVVVQHQINEYNFAIPANFNGYYPPGYPADVPPLQQQQMGFVGQYQADLQWRQQQRTNRIMHDRGMEFNYFGGFNWG